MVSKGRGIRALAPAVGCNRGPARSFIPSTVPSVQATGFTDAPLFLVLAPNRPTRGRAGAGAGNKFTLCIVSAVGRIGLASDFESFSENNHIPWRLSQVTAPSKWWIASPRIHFISVRCHVARQVTSRGRTPGCALTVLLDSSRGCHP